ncbi:hypothetical protein D3C71_1645820 [compost metagenome]
MLIYKNKYNIDNFWLHLERKMSSNCGESVIIDYVKHYFKSMDIHKIDELKIVQGKLFHYQPIPSSLNTDATITFTILKDDNSLEVVTTDMEETAMWCFMPNVISLGSYILLFELQLDGLPSKCLVKLWSDN